MLSGTEVTRSGECGGRTAARIGRLVGVAAIGEGAVDTARHSPFEQAFDLPAAGQQMALRRQRTARSEVRPCSFANASRASESVTQRP